MNLKIEKSSVDRKRVAILAGLLILGLIVYLFNRSGSGDSGSSTPTPKAKAPQASEAEGGFDTYGARPLPRASTRTQRAGMGTLKDFQPTMKPKGIDPATIDPTLHLDELAKLQGVKVDGAQRSLFKFSESPPPEVLLAKVVEPAKIKPRSDVYGPKPQPPPPPPAPPPPPPPIPLKFYGFVDPKKTGGEKRAFFLDGEEIIVAGEGDMVKKRYKIVHIGVNSAVVEDTQAENNQQTLPLVKELNAST